MRSDNFSRQAGQAGQGGLLVTMVAICSRKCRAGGVPLGGQVGERPGRVATVRQLILSMSYFLGNHLCCTKSFEFPRSVVHCASKMHWPTWTGRRWARWAGSRGCGGPQAAAGCSTGSWGIPQASYSFKKCKNKQKLKKFQSRFFFLQFVHCIHGIHAEAKSCSEDGFWWVEPAV